MTQINLLPWREQARKEKKIQFGFSMLAFAIFGLVVIAILHIYFAGMLSFQGKRNAFLQTALDEENAAILNLNKKKEELNHVDVELHNLFSLREHSYRAVMILDELENIIPEGVTFTKITRQGDTVTINGTAKSNLQVTKLMKSLESSHVFMQPTLTQINSDESEKSEERIFELKVVQEE